MKNYIGCKIRALGKQKLHSLYVHFCFLLDFFFGKYSDRDDTWTYLHKLIHASISSVTRVPAIFEPVWGQKVNRHKLTLE